MSLVRAVCVASIFLGPSSVFAQQPVPPNNPGARLPTCTSSMIVGTWQAAFGYGTPLYGTAQNNGFYCPLVVASNGTVTSGPCVLGSGMTVSPAPSGNLTIDNKCHVVGSLTFGYCNQPNSCVNSWQMAVSLWRSADGSRLSGMQVLTCPKCKNIQDPAVTWVSPFEMIAGQ